MTYYSASSTTNNYTLLKVDGGYYDYHAKDAATVTVSHYRTKTSAAKTSYWQTATSTLGATPNVYGVFALSSAAQTYDSQKTNELFSASFETVNIFFDKEALSSSPVVEMFLVSAVSLAKLTLSYAPDGNYTLSTTGTGDRYSQGSVEETGSIANDTIRYKGSKQIIIQSIQFDARDSQSIRFKVEAYLTDGTNTYLDDIRIKAIHVLPNDVIYMGGETYA